MMPNTPPRVSFEFFPPKTEQAEVALWSAITKLAPLGPSFVSVTYGAGGSTRERTHATVRRIREETDLEPAAHLTCIGSSRDEIAEIARRYWAIGVRHIVALRGDPPAEGAGYVPHPEGFAHAGELVAALARVAPFEISVAAYPEGHPEAASLDADLDHLKRKIDAGATRAITQFFFEAADYLRFVERARKCAITVPIVPGILPVTNVAQVTRFAAQCGARVPHWLTELFDGLDADPETRKLVACTVAVDQVNALASQGVEDFHFYTLNRADLVTAICRRLGLKPKLEAAMASAPAV